MADLSRQSVLMPTIKCSNCGNQVEISMMGEHTCGGASDTASSEPVPPTPDLLGGAFSSLKQNVFDKFTRAPPTVDTSAANDAFAKQEQLPMSASTASQAISPKTPMSLRPGAGSSNDDYFSPAIASSPRRPGGYGGLSTEPELYESESAYGTSPNKPNNMLLTRMNSIAPGPFDTRSRPAKSSFPRRTSKDEVVDSSDDSSRLGTSIERPGTAASGSSATSGSLAAPKMPRKNGYGGFGPPQKENEELEPRPLTKRSDTFPNQLLKAQDPDFHVDSLARIPSAPGPRPERPRRPSEKEEAPVMISERKHRPSHGLRDTSRPPPPRKSLIRPPTRHGSQNLSINLADEFGVGNPYHSPSVSQSSNNSGFSQESQASQPSSTTSPARSVKSAPRRPSEVAAPEALVDDMLNSMENLRTASPSIPAKPMPISRKQSLSPAAIPDPMQRKGSLTPNAARRGPLQDLRLDPAVQHGQDMRLESPVSPLEPGSAPSARLDPALYEAQGRTRSQTTSTVGSSAHNRQPSRNPRSRGNCRACREPIVGKSVSSADGRLTGRYHKACFVCTTCQEPFSSSTFYVHEDRPYCEQHYHKLNGSLCKSCNRGIEGEYLEDEVPQKYHPSCFRCGDCGIVLRDGYYDVNGKTYCERDAWQRRQQAVRAQKMGPPPSRQPSQRPSFSRPGPRTDGVVDVPSIPQPPRGLPSGPQSSLNRPFGLPTGTRLMPGQALGRGGLRAPPPIPRMEKRMTRLGMM
ncbi:hypothetical protein GGR57DRAFT_70223 [Xylariaceae sp. FL1272]|nr:hypothetical protein GGR57DRAFT_70223 [Xylariaceae sp. FL1272]